MRRRCPSIHSGDADSFADRIGGSSPGATEFTLIPLAPRLTAAARVIEVIAPFEAV